MHVHKGIRQKKIPDSEFKIGYSDEFAKTNQYWVFHENEVVHFQRVENGSYGSHGIGLLGGFVLNSRTLLTLLHVSDSLFG